MIIRTRIGRGCSARWVSALPMAACALLATPLMAQSLDQIGRWDPPPQPVGHQGGDYDWPLNAMHAVLLNDGTVLVWKYAHCGPPTVPSWDDERIWDPASGDVTSIASEENLDCAGHAGMADGTIFVPGGGCGPTNAEKFVRRFTFGGSGPWEPLADMHEKRWYPTATTLPDGRMLVTGGASGFVNDQHVHVEVPEIYDPATDTWEEAPQNHEHRDIGQYPFMFVMPDGRVFYAGSLTGEAPGQGLSEPTAILDPSDPDWAWQDVDSADYGSVGCRRSAVMYEPGKVLVSGGNHGSSWESANRTIVIDLTVLLPAWDFDPQLNMNNPRSGHDLVLLPDGKILAVGGIDKNLLPLNPAVMEAEWIDMGDAFPLWSTLAEMENPRSFHSVSLLLPDGRILVAGSDDHLLEANETEDLIYDFWEETAEVFSPPYLFHNGDELAPRPVVGFAPRAVDYDEAFRVTLAAGEVEAEDIDRVTMVRPGAVTHGFDSNQRFIELDFTIDAANNRVEITAPLNGNVAPPGEWMLFLIADTGVPSVGKFIRLILP